MKINYTHFSSLPISKFLTPFILILAFFLPATSVFAKKVKVSDGTVIYTLDTSTKTASVTGYEENASSSSKVVILDNILNTDDGASYKVTAIGKEAFQGSFFKNISLPSTIETIGSYAFATCSLKKLELPANLKTVGAYAFSDAYQSKTPVDLIIPSNCTAIKTCAFNGCSIRSIRFNSKLTTLGDYCFGNTDIFEVEVPASVTSLGKGVFCGCPKLTKAVIKGTPSTLPEGFFDRCAMLSSVTLPSSISSIGTWAFSECTSLKTLTLPSSLKTIGGYVFYKSGLETVTLPSGLRTLGDHAFAYITSLKEITIPASVSTISDYCFDGSTALMTVRVLNPTPCSLGTCGFDSETYYDGLLITPSGAEPTYRYAKEWGCFRSLHYSGVEEERVTAIPSRPVKRLGKGGIVIERKDGDRFIQYDLDGHRR